MGIEWAPISVDGSRNPAVRRHARSLAMRQYRRRQKEEVERKHKSTTEDSASTTAMKSRPRRSVTPASSVSTKIGSRNSKPKSLVFNSLSWRKDAEERIQEPEVIADSLRLCKKYLQWLRPDGILTDADFTLYVAQQELPDPLLIAASHLVAGRYLDAAHFRAPGKKCDERKNEVLASLKARLKDGEMLVSGDVVNAIVCLLHYELCEGNDEALVHLQGVKALIGTIDPSSSRMFASCAMSLEMGDLMHALMFSRKAEFVSLGKQSPFSEPTYSSYHASILTKELDQINDLIIYPYFTKVDTMMQDVSRKIEKSLDGPQIRQREARRNSPFEKLSRSIGTLSQQTQLCDLELFVQAAKATNIIIYRYAVLKYPFNDLENQSQVDPIIAAMIHVPSERWRVLKYFRLFMLLAALCAAEEPRRRSFCEAHLVRAMLQLGPQAWLNTRSVADTANFPEFFVKFINNVSAVRAPPAGQASLHRLFDTWDASMERHIEAVKLGRTYAQRVWIDTMDQNTPSTDQNAVAGRDSNDDNNHSNTAPQPPRTSPSSPSISTRRLQLAYDIHGIIHPVDLEGPDLLPYQIHLLQTASAATLQRYKDRILLAYEKSLRYLGREGQGVEIVNEKLGRAGEEGALNEMVVEVNGLFRMIFGPFYDGEVVRNAEGMGGRL
ncbi:hypothetical protein M409DRAFT_60478 [Zasmidium cellare ATCC 36951]|uniref:Uncharacterized protein n=1 Tax=Zasmidium cellare ATCC 36951 TaxID=1080233 RepID=A0A6A6BYK9_ZASCE|nr:uncharacterized protein M409DRAFT_60478 [Zasmidium cellare ATCC 36951]KAF2159887.1 hypothetical protein M409DRAFT_60478 [Zasmidium cellare ATCC 36951]